jgi:hypothetical protein
MILLLVEKYRQMGTETALRGWKIHASVALLGQPCTADLIANRVPPTRTAPAPCFG